MSAGAYGWIRVWIPPVIEHLGIWQIQVEQSSGLPAQVIPAAAQQTMIVIIGSGLFGPAQFSLSLELSVYVEPSRITEVHIPTSWLDRILAPAGTSAST